MKYLPLLLILGMVGGCAIVAYEILDAIERDEDQDPTGAVGRARVVVLDPVPSTLPRVSTQRPSGQFWHSRPHGRGTGNGEAGPEWLDGRIRGLEEQLDRLERDCLRVEALAREQLPSPARRGGNSSRVVPTDRETHRMTSAISLVDDLHIPCKAHR